MYFVILAGGGGTRLWPLSRPERPKPFLPLFDDGTLFQKTVRRLAGTGAGGAAPDVTVVAAGPYAALARAQVGGVSVLEEPQGRNTAAAIALATLAIDRPDDEVMVVLPADHLVVREDAFRDVIAAAGGIAGGALGIAAPLVTLGVQPDRPATEYGYLVPNLDDGADVLGLRAQVLSRFEEKPDAVRAAALLELTGVAWNAGIFVWQRQAIRGALATHGRDILTAIEAGLATDSLSDAYATVRSVSIDYAVMEPAAAAGAVVMAAMNVGWSDLGGWSALLAAIGAPGTGRVVQADEAAEAGAADMVVERVDGRLVLSMGPRGILGAGPAALLRDAARGRDAVEALLDRVRRWEEQP